MRHPTTLRAGLQHGLSVIALVVLSAAAFAPRPAAAGTMPPTASPPSAVVISKMYGAALHEGPSSDAPIETVAACGDVFAVTASTDGWLEVNSATGMLWVGEARVTDADNPSHFTCGGQEPLFPGDSVLSGAPGGCLALSAGPSSAAVAGVCNPNGATYTVLGAPITGDDQDWIALGSPSTGTGWALAQDVSPTTPTAHLQSYAASPDADLSPLLAPADGRGPLLALRLVSVCGNFALLYLAPNGPAGPGQPGLLLLQNDVGTWSVIAAGSAFPPGDRFGAPDAIFDSSVPCSD